MALLQDDRTPEARLEPQRFYESGPKIGQAGFNSMKVGFTLRNGHGKIIEAFAYPLNPQGITRQLSTRSQVFATKGGFYLDHFGSGPEQITVRQLVASGRKTNTHFYTPREEIQRFLKRIYLPAVHDPAGHACHFHDNHFERGHESRVFFPENGLTIQRAVDLHNVWLVEYQMVNLERFPYTDVEAKPSPNRPRTRRYLVKAHDTLTKLAVRLLRGHSHRHVPGAKVKAMVHRLLVLNPKLRKKRKFKVGDRTITLKPHQLHAGEIIRVPA